MFKYIFLILFSCYLNLIFFGIIEKRNNCTAIYPGGVPGFWYSLGKINNDIKYENKRNFLCASSGCLSVLSKDIPFQTLIKNIRKINRQTVSFREKKAEFINFIINKTTAVPNMRILTMNIYGTCIENKPNNISELKKLLKTTTDIPFITSEFVTEFDGGLCFNMFNDCINTIVYSKKLRYIRDTFNIRLNIKDILYIYQENL